MKRNENCYLMYRILCMLCSVGLLSAAENKQSGASNSMMPASLFSEHKVSSQTIRTKPRKLKDQKRLDDPFVLKCFNLLQNTSVPESEKIAFLKLFQQQGYDCEYLYHPNMWGGPEWSAPICIAASNRDWDVVTYLLEHGISVNTSCPSGYTPLHYAASEGDCKGIRFLLGLGASLKDKTDDGVTALEVYKEYHNDPDILKALAH